MSKQSVCNSRQLDEWPPRPLHGDLDVQVAAVQGTRRHCAMPRRKNPDLGLAGDVDAAGGRLF